MKKTILFAALALSAGYSFAAGNAIAANAGAVALNNGNCPYLPTGNTATINLSKDVIGAYECNNISAAVATAHPQGKKKVYSVGSAGGSMTETSTAAAPVSNDVTSATNSHLSS